MHRVHVQCRNQANEIQTLTHSLPVYAARLATHATRRPASFLKQVLIACFSIAYGRVTPQYRGGIVPDLTRRRWRDNTRKQPAIYSPERLSNPQFTCQYYQLKHHST